MATFRAGMEPPANVADAMTAPGPLTKKQRMDKVVIGSKKDLKADDLRALNPVLEPVSGEEVSVEKEKVSKKKFASGGYTRAADGCAQRGKTRGKMV